MDVSVDGLRLEVRDEIAVAVGGTATDGLEAELFFHRLGLEIRTEFGEPAVVFGNDNASFAMAEDAVLFIEPRRQVGFGIGEVISHGLGM